jgi:hypothetical protein
MNSAVSQIAQIVTDGSQTTVDFTSIDGSFSSLQIVWTAQDTQPGTSRVDLNLSINGDGIAAHYSPETRLACFNGTVTGITFTATPAGAYVGSAPQSGNANVVGDGRIFLPGYATASHKNVSFEAFADCASGLPRLAMQFGAFRWMRTDPIIRLTFSTAGAAFKDGSVFTLYGYP